MFDVALRPQRQKGLGLLAGEREAEEGHLEFHTVPELCVCVCVCVCVVEVG